MFGSYEEGSPHRQLLSMSRWYVVSRALHAIAQLGVANVMTLEAKPLVQIAKDSDTKADYLRRILKYLTAYHIFEEPKDDYFQLTALSMPLRDDDPYSVRHVLQMVDDDWWQAMGSLSHCLSEGGSAFESVHGEHFFNHLKKQNGSQSNFDRGMAKLSSYDDESIVLAYDFTPYRRVIDIGGGKGGLIRALKKSYPHLSLSLFDSSSVIEQLKTDTTNPLPCNLCAGNFFDLIPNDEDVYIFKGVLHDFNDKDTVTILSNCRTQIPIDAKVLLAEQVIPDDNAPHPNKTMDIVMMALLDGRQRLLSDWTHLAEQAGYTLERVIPTDSHFSLIELRLGGGSK